MYKSSKKNIKFNKKIIARLKETLQTLADLYENNLIEVLLFGSYAKGTQSKFSSLDILVVIKKSNERFIKRKTDIEKILNDESHIEKNVVLVDILIYTEKELMSLINENESFLVSALNESILLWSNAENINIDDLKKLKYHISRYKKYLPNLEEIYV